MLHISKKVKYGAIVAVGAGGFMYSVIKLGEAQPNTADKYQITACARHLGNVATDVAERDVPKNCAKFALSSAMSEVSQEMIVHLPSSTEFRQDPPELKTTPSLIADEVLALFTGALAGTIIAGQTENPKKLLPQLTPVG